VLRAGDVAAAYGATDVLVLRRVTDDKWAHLGGAGLGEDWIGFVDPSPDGDEPVLRAALGSRKVVRNQADKPARVIGPYYARQWAVLRVDGDYVIVLGRSDAEVPLASDVRDADLRVKCATLVGTVGMVTPAKRLADELKVLDAMQKIYQVPQVSSEETLRMVVKIVTDALSCDIGLLITGSGRMAVQCDDPLAGWDPIAARAAVEAVLPRIGHSALCVQGADGDPLPAPLDPAHGICSYYIVPTPEPIGGAFAVFHTERTPRGFTAACQQLGRQLSMAAASIIHAAELREQLRAEVQTAQQQAFVDPLTGVGNRRSWEAAISDAQRRVGLGRPASVIVLDLNGLKEANDQHGHQAGDEVLRRFAGAVQRAVRAEDVVCRIGGDELFVLLIGADSDTCRDVVARIRLTLASESRRGPLPLSASVGWATTGIDCTLPDAVVTADGRMYADKRRQRSGRGVARTGT
jgi:diguanylate cyclase (GGDEF)-like protein